MKDIKSSMMLIRFANSSISNAISTDSWGVRCVWFTQVMFTLHRKSGWMPGGAPWPYSLCSQFLVRMSTEQVTHQFCVSLVPVIMNSYIVLPQLLWAIKVHLFCVQCIDSSAKDQPEHTHARHQVGNNKHCKLLVHVLQLQHLSKDAC